VVGNGMYGVLTPITPAVRSGWSTGIAQATKPPQSCPAKTARSRPKASSSATRSPGEVLEIVGLHGRGRVAAAVAALVGRDHAEAGGGQGRDLAAPRVGELGEAVAQHHRRAASALVHGQRQGRLAGARGAGALGERHPPRRWERLGHQGRSLPRSGARFPHPLVP